MLWYGAEPAGRASSPGRQLLGLFSETKVEQMRVTIDLELCEGHGMCMMAAPEIFEVPDGADAVILLQREPPEASRAEVEDAAETCPVRAITVD